MLSTIFGTCLLMLPNSGRVSEAFNTVARRPLFRRHPQHQFQQTHHQLRHINPLFYTDDESQYSIPVVISNREEQKRQWIDRSVQYYSKVMRETEEERLVNHEERSISDEEFLILAKKHYFALTKIRDGRWDHAEAIYRRILEGLMPVVAIDADGNQHADSSSENKDCSHAKLAVTTLLLALLLQRRVDNVKETRSVFLSFFRRVVLHDSTPCACSAKVLQAFALFEMKQGNAVKSLQIARIAVQLDPKLRPVLNWKQFREVQQRETYRDLAL